MTYRTLAGALFLSAVVLALVTSTRADAPPAPAPPPKPPTTVTLLAPLASADSDSKETTYGDLVADAVRTSAGADVALIPADELGTVALPEGGAPIADIVKGLRYAGDADDTIVVMTVSGKQLRMLAERSIQQSPSPFPGFLQVSGATIALDPTAHTVRVTVGAAPMVDERPYLIATTRSVADGGFGYYRALDGLAGKSTKVGVADAVTRYLQAHPALAAPAGKRVEIQ